ncbi:MAG: hypothetical protein DMF62_03060 [Acidobacteria bacterium]|nr:MAG: hypothetical protein DMF62_03060 [Acidobacteriota bacterium]
MNKDQPIILHLLSGGLDSVTLLYKLHREDGYKVLPLLFDYGQTHSKELTFARRHCEQLNLPFVTYALQLPVVTMPNSPIIPNRNAILISLAVNIAIIEKATAITIGCNADDAEVFPDCTRSFLTTMAAAIDWAELDVELWAPFLDLRKIDILKLSKKYNIRLDDIWTCYAGGETPCGKCLACQKLAAAQNDVNGS